MRLESWGWSSMGSVTDRLHMGRVAGLGCMLCRHQGIHGSPAEVHHPRTGTGAGRRSAHMDTIPLCPNHHRHGPEALHVMGRKAWERYHGITELELLDMTREALGIFPLQSNKTE